MKTLKRRKKEKKTDYKKRMNLLKSDSPRIVFRKTNRYIIAQYVTSRTAQDRIERGITSESLINYGWPKEYKGSLKSVPASYLTGFLFGKKLLKNFKKTEKVFPVDIGMIRAVHKNRFFAFLKGLKDSGIPVTCDDKNFPSEERITGKHMKKDFSEHFNEIKSVIEKKEL